MNNITKVLVSIGGAFSTVFLFFMLGAIFIGGCGIRERSEWPAVFMVEGFVVIGMLGFGVGATLAELYVKQEPDKTNDSGEDGAA